MIIELLGSRKHSSNHLPTRDTEDSNLTQDKPPNFGYFDKFPRRRISCAYIILQPCLSTKFSYLW